MTWQDYYDFPVTYKRWLIERIKKEIEKGKDNGNELTKGAHHNDAQTRALLGRHRPESPARLRRFTWIKKAQNLSGLFYLICFTSKHIKII